MSISEPRWLSRPVVDAAHHELLRTFGGADGCRDEAAVVSIMLGVASGAASDLDGDG
ncbi:MAG: hypothetical protein FWF71_00205 [Actinomycetia bacterium]|nr:hypothetical protein [Actinomycetes bacterium]